MTRKSGFRPAWWLRGAHAQTLWPHFLRRQPDVPLTWERLDLPDGDFVDLVWTGGDNGPIVVLLHGLEGSIHSHYSKGMLSALHKHGWRAVLMHFRGCSGTHNRMARGYHSGDTGDLKYLINTLRSRYPEGLLAAVGFSLGGNVLLKYLGEEQTDAGLDAAVSVSVPFELSRSADRLNQGLSRFYQRHLIRRLQERVMDKFGQRNDAPFALSDIHQWNDFHAFDNFVTARLHGFAGSSEYYRLCSSRPFIKSITVPTLIIQAEDDPFLPGDAIPIAADLSDNVTLELSRHGGHMGFISGRLPWHPRYWLEQRIPEFLSPHLTRIN